MPLSAFVRSVTFINGKKIDLETDSIIVIVGPNNCGKTTTLKSIYEVTQIEMAHSTTIDGELKCAQNPTVKYVGLEIDASIADLKEFLDENSKIIENHYVIRQKSGIEHKIAEISALGEHNYSFGIYASLFASIFNTEQKITFANTQSAIDYGRSPYIHPLHHLHQKKSLRERLYQSFYAAFGVEIGIDTMAGMVVPLHVGDGAFVRPGETETDEDYLTRLRALPRLETQGDGMRSYVGTLLSSAVLGHKILFIDEPETFLHPPQIRQMAKSFGSVASNKQIFIATHSPDFVRGLLESGREGIVIIRLDRFGGSTNVSQLRGDNLREVWSDPALRYSNGLDGIFYGKTIVCEADGDCKFYAVLSDALREVDGNTVVRDPLFVQAGGKGGVPKIVRALKSLSVPVVAVVDFDVFRQIGQFRSILESLGADYNKYKDDLKIVRDAIDKIGTNKVTDAKKAIISLIEELKDDAESIPPSTIKGINRALKPSQGWELAKTSGVSLFKGAARVSAERLLRDLATIGLHVVPSGELESFVPQETEDKNLWVQKILADYGNTLASATELVAARKFIITFMKP